MKDEMSNNAVLYREIRDVITTARRTVTRTVNHAMVQTYWQIRYLLKVVSSGTSWVNRLRNLLDEYLQVNPLMIGFPEDWREREFWRRVG